jgi:transmembrane sensor
MNNEEARKLLERYQEGQCTEGEKVLVDSWYSQFNEDDSGIPSKIIREWGNEIFNKLPGNGQEQKRITIWPLAIASNQNEPIMNAYILAYCETI